MSDCAGENGYFQAAHLGGGWVCLDGRCPQHSRMQLVIAEELCACDMTNGFCKPSLTPGCRCNKIATQIVRHLNELGLPPTTGPTSEAQAQETVVVPTEPTEAMLAAGMAAMNDLVRPVEKPMERPTIAELEKILNSDAPPGVRIHPDGTVSTLEERTTTTRAAAHAAYKAMLGALKLSTSSDKEQGGW